MAQSSPGNNIYIPISKNYSQLEEPDELDFVLSLLVEDATRTSNLRRRQSKNNCRPDHCSSAQLRRRRRFRTTFTTEQINKLEEEFINNHYLTTGRLTELSSKLLLRPLQIQIWFKNRRRRQKIRKQEEYIYDIMGSSLPANISSPNLNSSVPLVPATITDITSTSVSDLPVISDLMSCSLPVADQLNADLPTILPTTIDSLSSGIVGRENLNQNIASNNPGKPNNIDIDTINIIENALLCLNNDTKSAINTEINSTLPDILLLQQYRTESETCFVNKNAPTTATYSGTEIAQSEMLQIPSSRMSPKITQFQTQPLEQETSAAITSTNYHQSAHYKLTEQNTQTQNICESDIDLNYNHSYYTSLQTDQQQKGNFLNAKVSKCLESTQLPAFEEFYKNRELQFDDSSSSSSGSGSNSTDSDDLEPTKMLNNLVMSNDMIRNSVKSNKRSRDDYEGHSINSSVAMLDQNTAAGYTKYRKLTNTTDPNYLCTMDKLMHSYNNHRNVSNASQHLAYCFN